MITLNTRYLQKFISDSEFSKALEEAKKAHRTLTEKTGEGNDFLGWVELPYNYDKEEYARIKTAAEKIRRSCDVLLVLGIGGSYLGARAVIEAVTSPLYNQLKKNSPEIYFLGNSISSSYFNDVLSLCEGKDICVNVISKSGTTTEPALAFRIIREMMEKKYGKDGAKDRIFATTDKAKGTLKELADREGYEAFVVPDDIGGRYSVLTAVGLLPIAAAGIDTDALFRGAQDAYDRYREVDPEKNDCCRYAAARNLLLRKGKQIEVTEAYEPGLWCFCEWIKQLFGESEGKDGKGLFPAGMIFSTDLHSLGQFIQQGTPNMFETVLWADHARSDITVKEEDTNGDGLNFLAGKTMQEVNRNAFIGTVLAHVDGGTPNMILELPQFDAYHIGALIYFYEKSCGISAYMLGVNPFNQPGVQMYKSNMFALLGKPGYEREGDLLRKKLK